MSEWRECKLGDLLEKVIDNRGKNPPYSTEGFEVIETKCISGKKKYPNYNLVDKFVDEDTYENWFRSGHPKTDDLLIITVGNGIGSVSILKENRGVLTQNLIGLRFKDIANSNFYFYLLNQETIQDFLKSMDIGSAQPSLKVPHLLGIEVFYPPLPEQKAIAEVLSSLDDKIDLLHRQNQTLEALAETLFRQWFIEEAQEDWEEKPLDEIANYLNGLACQKIPPKNDFDKLPVLKIKDLRSGFTESSDWATTEVDQEYIVENGDVIFSWSGSLMIKIWDGERCVLNQHLFKVTSEIYPKWFYYFWTKYYMEKFIAIAESKATTMGHIKRADLSSSKVIIPSIEQLKIMDETIVPLFEKIILNNKQLSKLESLRDTLLPNLMSGEVRVR